MRHTHTHTNNAHTHTTPRYEIAMTVTAAGAYKVSVSSQGIFIPPLTLIITPALPNGKDCVVSTNFAGLVSDMFLVMVMIK